MTDHKVRMAKQHVLTIALEDYYHVGTLNKLIQRGQWYRFEPRLEQNTHKVLNLLDRHNIKATFFVVGWIASRYPNLIREVAERGHEIASQGYFNRSVQQMTRKEFEEDILRSRDALERAGRTQVIGYRVAHELFFPSDLWALEVLAEADFVYDSSISPIFRRYAHEPWRRFVHKLRFGDKQLWEFPLSSLNVLGWHVPIAGGNYFRQFPHFLMKRGVEYWHRTQASPFVMYFHVWELDPDLPKINTPSFISKIRHYRNLEKMEWILEDYFNRYSFTSIAQYLRVSTALSEAPESVSAARHFAAAADAVQAGEVERAGKEADGEFTGQISRTPVTIVVPCFNEEQILPYLSNTLKSVRATLEPKYDLRFVFVDDGSRDRTLRSLHDLFESSFPCKVIHHGRNVGVAGAILTGIRHADTEVVCSIDCDCTYDPHELANMIPMLKDGIDMVTASPYHPQGRVRNVEQWRLKISKASSFLYRLILRQKLFTYTSCFRVYRRSKIVSLRIADLSFPGVAEMLARMDAAGSRIVEYPTTLEARLLGRSKMRIMRQVFSHLRVMCRALWWRFYSDETGRHPLMKEGCLTTPSTGSSSKGNTD